MLTDTDIQEFQALYRKHFGKDLDMDEARKMAEDVIRLVQVVYAPNKIQDSRYGL
jgi:hypothetical protein